MPEADDLQRLRAEYARRSQQGVGSRYTPFAAGHLFAIHGLQRAVIAMLRDYRQGPLAGKHILEIGCGEGRILYEFLGLHASPGALHGVDLLPDRLRVAHDWLPHLPLACADGQRLPYATHTFDLVLQYTAFSSILDDAIKARVAREMLRVLRPEGLILWYDFWLNPANPQTRGIRPGEIRALFPGCTFTFRRITLAPPVARRLAPLSWILAALLEKLWILNTHYLAAIRRQAP